MAQAPKPPPTAPQQAPESHASLKRHAAPSPPQVPFVSAEQNELSVPPGTLTAQQSMPRPNPEHGPPSVLQHTV